MIQIIMGAQFGSEGKGSVCSAWSAQNDFDLVIQTGGANSGHTVLFGGDELIILRHLPCSWVSNSAPIYIPSGAVVDAKVLLYEIGLIREYGFPSPIYISPFAAVILDKHKLSEKEITSGTTGSGTGAARAEKCLRQCPLAKDVPMLGQYLGMPTEILNNHNSRILIESSQGFGLGLNSKYYPFVTSTNITPYQILSDADIPFLTHKIEVILVVRTFPIRVMGNSGELLRETSWWELRRKFGDHILDEYSSVTKNIRRVGEFNVEQVKEATVACNPQYVILTFVDYLFPNIRKTGITKGIREFLNNIESQIGKKIDYFGIGNGELLPTP